jgi:hypothetical protein
MKCRIFNHYIGKVVISFLMGLFFTQFISAQLNKVNPASRLEQQLALYDSLYPQEKVYLHFDRDGYRPGETIWFKAYLLKNDFPLTESRHLFVELVNGRGDILQKKMYPINLSNTFGEFSRTDTLPEGFYLVRAYTTWMRNFSDSFLFQKVIPVFKQNYYNRARQINELQVPQLRFYPEGGHLLLGMVNKVVIRSCNNKGQPLRAEGRIIDEQGATMMYFKTTENGLASVKVKPQVGKKYFAEITIGKTPPQKFPLPEAEKTAAIELSPAPNGCFVTIKKSDTATDYGVMRLMIVKETQAIFNTEVTIPKNENRGRILIPYDDMSAGLATIYLSDQSGKLLSERKFFIPAKPAVHFLLDSVRVSAKSRALNSFDILLKDSLPLYYSVSITDAERDGRDPLNTTLGYASHIQSETGSYLDNNLQYADDSLGYAESVLDMQLIASTVKSSLTDFLFHDRKPLIRFSPDTALIPRFQVISEKNSFKNSPVNLFLTDASLVHINDMLNTRVDTNSRFDLGNLDLFDSIKVFHKFGYVTGEKYTIAQIPPHFQYLKDSIALPFKLSQLYTSADGFLPNTIDNPDRNPNLFDSTKVTTLQTVTLRSKRERMKELDEKYTRGLFTGNPGAYEFDLITDPPPRSMNLWNYLTAKVAGIGIGRPSILRDRLSANVQKFYIWRGMKMCLFIDEVNIDLPPVGSSGLGVLHGIMLDEVAYIKVLRPPFTGVSMNDCRGGAIAVYMKQGGDKKNAPVPGLPAFIAKGYDKSRYFPAKDYSDPLQNTREPDLRSTLYWNPQLQFDPETQQARVSFYNNDITRKFRIVIEGMNMYGVPVRFEQVIEGTR